MTLYEDVNGPKPGWWRALLVGGPRDGQETALEAPYPFADVPEGRYRRRDEISTAVGATLTYDWEGGDRTTFPGLGPVND